MIGCAPAPGGVNIGRGVGWRTQQVNHPEGHIAAPTTKRASARRNQAPHQVPNGLVPVPSLQRWQLLHHGGVMCLSQHSLHEPVSQLQQESHDPVFPWPSLHWPVGSGAAAAVAAATTHRASWCVALMRLAATKSIENEVPAGLDKVTFATATPPPTDPVNSNGHVCSHVTLGYKSDTTTGVARYPPLKKIRLGCKTNRW